MTSECKPAVPGEVQHHCEIYEEINYSKEYESNIAKNFNPCKFLN